MHELIHFGVPIVTALAAGAFVRWLYKPGRTQRRDSKGRFLPKDLNKQKERQPFGIVTPQAKEESFALADVDEWLEKHKDVQGPMAPINRIKRDFNPAERGEEAVEPVKPSGRKWNQICACGHLDLAHRLRRSCDHCECPAFDPNVKPFRWDIGEDQDGKPVLTKRTVEPTDAKRPADYTESGESNPHGN